MTNEPQAIPIDHELADTASSVESTSEIETLRGILLGQQAGTVAALQSRLDLLEQRIVDPVSRARDTSEVLAEAVAKRIKEDDHLGAALKPVVVEQFRETSRDDPELMAEALFPILGPAVRKMIINILSPDKKSKRRTYRVEQLFLIHSTTGLPVVHVAAASASTQDADMVSGMLSAIQSFVKEAFDTEEFDSLNTLQLGDVSVWIEWGPEAVLAAVVRGVPPKNLRDALQIQIEDIHLRFSGALSTYDGDASAFDELDPELNGFLEKHDGRIKNRIKNLPERARMQLIGCALLATLVLAWLCYNWYDARRWQNHVAELEQHPGIVVTDQQHGFRHYYVAGLRDPMAINPVDLLIDTSIKRDLVDYQFEAYQAIHPEFIIQRAANVLDPPLGVEFRFENTTLIISNVIDRDWGASAKKYAYHIAGVNQVIVQYSDIIK